MLPILLATLLGAVAPAPAPADEAAPITEAEAALIRSLEPLPIQGSSTVAPFALVAGGLTGEAPGAATRIVVEAAGTSAGIAALCGVEAAPLVAASRPIGPSELADCAASAVTTVVEIEIGLGAIVLAQSAKAAPLTLTLSDLYYAAAAQVPDDQCRMMPNRSRRWSDIRSDLPDRPINLYGPPPTSGTQGVLTTQGFAAGARINPCLADLEAVDPEAFEQALAIRRDGVWVDAGESDGALAYALTRLPEAVGILGRVHVSAQDGVVALPLNGITASAETIADGGYPLAHPLYLYTTARALTSDARVRPLALAFSRPEATGPDGILTGMGLVVNPAGSAARLINTEDGSATPLPLGR